MEVSYPSLTIDKILVIVTRAEINHIEHKWKPQRIHP